MNGVRHDSGIFRLLMAGTLVLFLAACSNSGVKNDRDMYKERVAELNEELQMVRMQIEAVTEELGEKREELATANSMIRSKQTEIDGLNDDVTDLTTMRDAYEMQLENLRTSGRDEDQTEITRLEGEITSLNGRITSLNGQIMTLESEKADFEDERDELQMDIGTETNPGLEQDVAALVEALETRLMAEGLTADEVRERVVELVGDIAMDFLPVPEPADPEEVARQMRIATLLSLDAAIRDMTNTSEMYDGIGQKGFTIPTVTRDGDTVTVEVEGFAGQGSAMVDDDGWASVMIEDGDRAVLVATSIAPRGPLPFTDVYGGNPAVAAVLAGTTPADMARRAVVEVAEFPTDPLVTKSFFGTSGNTATITGTLDGVQGRFWCATANTGCTVSTDSSGNLADSDMNWRFTPDSNLATIMSEDPVYVAFGWWVEKEGEWDAEVFDVRRDIVWYMQPDREVGPATGTATYEGPAVGKFTFKAYDYGEIVDAEAGHFRAKATLEANWGDDTEAGTIGGGISEFVLNDELSVDWSVTMAAGPLEPTFLDPATSLGSTTADFGAGGVANAGQWVATSHYDYGETSVTPTYLTGRFEAATDLVALLGSFGVRRMDPDGN